MLDIRRRTTVLFGLLCLGQLMLISFQVQTKNGLPLVKAGAFGIFASLQRGTAAVADFTHGLWDHYVLLTHTSRENDALKQHVLSLEGQVQQESAAASRTRALQEALDLKQTLAERTLAARVIAGDPSPGSLTVTIDRGADDGVKADMAVIAANGVVGRVEGSPQAHAAQVQLLVGRDAAAGAALERAGVGGIAVGGGNPPLQLKYVSTAANITVGERVLTSGQDGIYPPGLLIGWVARADKSSGEFSLIAVQPAVDFSHIDVVLVILTPPARVGGPS